MENRCNILLTSVGRRSYLVKYFKEAVDGIGEVHIANSSDKTPPFALPVKKVVTPLIYDRQYIPFLLEYCQKNQITAIVPLFDVDLYMLACNEEQFSAIGVRLIVSDKTVIEICNDKWNTYQFLRGNGIETPETYVSIRRAKEKLLSGDIMYPVMVKPRWGMGSIGVYKAGNEEELDFFYKRVKKEIFESYLKYEAAQDEDSCVLIQECIQGQEYGLDVINDLSGRYQNTIVKKKYAMRAGETDCAEIADSVELVALGEKVSIALRHIANLDMDVMERDGKYYVIEMNARFGGGYPFGHMAGVNLPKAIVRWLNGEKVSPEMLSAKTGVLVHKDINMLVLEV